MQINRLFEMVYLLLERGSMTAGELAERFEVSTRTVYRDLDTLSGAGIPVYASKGKGGGIRLLPDFVLNRSLLSDEEQNSILASLQGLAAVQAPEAEAVLGKLAGLFGKKREPWLEVDFVRWGGGEDEQAQFLTLRDAVVNGNVLRFTYYGSEGGPSARITEPLKIIFKGQSWYLYAFCRMRGAYRLFKLSRMKDAETLDERFERQESPRPVFGEPYQGELIPLRLRLDRSMGFRVYDEFPPDRIQRLENGDFIAELDMPRGEWAYGFILSFGTAAEVLSPPEIREEVQKRLKALLARYDSEKGHL